MLEITGWASNSAGFSNPNVFSTDGNYLTSAVIVHFDFFLADASQLNGYASAPVATIPCKCHFVLLSFARSCLYLALIFRNFWNLYFLCTGMWY